MVIILSEGSLIMARASTQGQLGGAILKTDEALSKLAEKAVNYEAAA